MNSNLQSARQQDKKEPVSSLELEQPYSNKITELFCSHPNSVNQSYLAHWKDAMRFSLTCGWCSFALFVHAFFPFLLGKTGSDNIISLWEEMMTKRSIAEENSLKAGKTDNTGCTE